MILRSQLTNLPAIEQIGQPIKLNSTQLNIKTRDSRLETRDSGLCLLVLLLMVSPFIVSIRSVMRWSFNVVQINIMMMMMMMMKNSRSLLCTHQSHKYVLRGSHTFSFRAISFFLFFFFSVFC